MKLQDLITEGTLPEAEIGKFKIRVIGSFRSSNPFLAGNVQAVVEFNGKKFGVLKQGGIGIWAFPQRTKMSNKEQKEFDKFMDANIDKVPKLKR